MVDADDSCVPYPGNGFDPWLLPGSFYWCTPVFGGGSKRVSGWKCRGFSASPDQNRFSLGRAWYGTGQNSNAPLASIESV